MEDADREYENECPICYHLLSNSVKCVAECGHSVCLSCNLYFEKHRRYICPLCRAPISKLQYMGGHKIYVSNLFGQIIIVNINLKYTLIKEILEIINVKFNHPTDELIIVFKGRPLNPNKTCSFYNIKENDIVYVIKKLSLEGKL